MANNAKFPVKTLTFKKGTCACESKSTSQHAKPMMMRQVNGVVQVHTTKNRTQSIKSRFLK